MMHVYWTYKPTLTYTSLGQKRFFSDLPPPLTRHANQEVTIFSLSKLQNKRYATFATFSTFVIGSFYKNDKITGRNDYIVHIMSENGLNMIDLVLTHLNQPWGPPWTLATLGDMLENDQFPPKWSFSSMSETAKMYHWN